MRHGKKSLEKITPSAFGAIDKKENTNILKIGGNK
jgi:ribosomal protein S7